MHNVRLSGGKRCCGLSHCVGWCACLDCTTHRHKFNPPIPPLLQKHTQIYINAGKLVQHSESAGRAHINQMNIGGRIYSWGMLDGFMGLFLLLRESVAWKEVVHRAALFVIIIYCGAVRTPPQSRNVFSSLWEKMKVRYQFLFIKRWCIAPLKELVRREDNIYELKCHTHTFLTFSFFFFFLPESRKRAFLSGGFLSWRALPRDFYIYTCSSHPWKCAGGKKKLFYFIFLFFHSCVTQVLWTAYLNYHYNRLFLTGSIC